MIPFFTGHTGLPVNSRRRQVITLAINPSRDEGDADAVRPVLGAVSGVEAVERDPASARVWVFANGAVTPESLVSALTSLGYAVHSLQNEFEWAA